MRNKLYSFDIVIGENGHPYILEINGCTSAVFGMFEGYYSLPDNKRNMCDYVCQRVMDVLIEDTQAESIACFRRPLFLAEWLYAHTHLFEQRYGVKFFFFKPQEFPQEWNIYDSPMDLVIGVKRRFKEVERIDPVRVVNPRHLEEWTEDKALFHAILHDLGYGEFTPKTLYAGPFVKARQIRKFLDSLPGERVLVKDNSSHSGQGISLYKKEEIPQEFIVQYDTEKTILIQEYVESFPYIDNEGNEYATTFRLHWCNGPIQLFQRRAAVPRIMNNRTLENSLVSSGFNQELVDEPIHPYIEKMILTLVNGVMGKLGNYLFNHNIGYLFQGDDVHTHFIRPSEDIVYYYNKLNTFTL